MAETIRSFRDLRVYGAAFAAAMDVRALVLTFPRAERYALGGQVLRSSRSVCANRAEAWRKRRYPAAFVSKLSDAEAEAEETRVFLDFAKACDFVSPADHARLDREYDRIVSPLVRMVQQADQWAVGRASGRRRAGPARPHPQSPSPPVPQSDGRARRVTERDEPGRAP